VKYTRVCTRWDQKMFTLHIFVCACIRNPVLQLNLQQDSFQADTITCQHLSTEQDSTLAHLHAVPTLRKHIQHWDVRADVFSYTTWPHISANVRRSSLRSVLVCSVVVSVSFFLSFPLNRLVSHHHCFLFFFRSFSSFYVFFFSFIPIPLP
jgi:hypothetical protein